MTKTITAAIRLRAPALVAAALLAGCASAPTAHLQVDPPRERAQIQRRLQEIFDAAEKKDLIRLDSYHCYGSKFTKFSASSPNRQDAIVAREGEHKGLAAINDLKMQADDLKIDVFGNVGIATFVLESRFKAGSNVIEKKEHATLVFVKEDGDWKITHEHFSPIKSNP